jgi:putative ABC transport system substrate-binding protein
MIGHRRFILAFALCLFAWSPSADAQQPRKVPLVAILSDESQSLGAKTFEPPFAQGLRDLGWVEGQNLTLERRYAAGNNELLSSFARQLVGVRPDVIFAIGTPAAQAAKIATETIPIVFARSADPIGFGLVATLARPGGNLTGLSDQVAETAAKRLELLIMAVPDAKRIGVLWDPSFPPAGAAVGEIQRAAKSLNREVVPVEVRAPEGFEPAYRALAEKRAGALMEEPSTLFAENLQQIADLAAKARFPAMGVGRRWVEAGILMSYAPDDTNRYRRVAAYVDKILRGAKPADIPVEQPTKFELVVNLKTAKALGLTVPQSILARADEVIE